jgi:hypothetical protein
LKKRNKKLLLFAPSRRFKWANQVLPLIGKSFLVLFFKKELLPSACLLSPRADIICGGFVSASAKRYEFNASSLSAGQSQCYACPLQRDVVGAPNLA